MKSKKRRRIGRLLTYCMFMLIGVASVSVTSKAETSADGFEYEVNDDGTATITGYTGDETTLVIPGGVDGHQVTSIGNSAFGECSNLTSIEIPEGVTSIKNHAFSECSSLTSITIPESVTNIGEYAFSGCSGLTSITIPESVTDIGEYAFSGCSGLTSITIPEGITRIRNYVFKNCSRLENIIFPSSITWISSSAFDNTPWIENMKNSTGGFVIVNHILVNGQDTKGEVVTPEGVTSIASSAFSGCSDITSITISEGVTSIGSYAFSNCSNLTSVMISKDVTSIGYNAFEKCSGLTSIKIPDNVTSIGEEAFKSCSGLTSIKISEGIAFIDDGVFSYCDGLTSVTIPDNVTSIGKDAFRGCSSLANVVIQEGVTGIGYEAFNYCSSLTSITIPKSVTFIDDAFKNVNENLIVHTEAGSCAARRAEENGYTVDIITVGEEYEINGDKFYYQILADGTVEITGYAGTASDLAIPAAINDKAVTSIKKYVFSGSSVQNITIPASVTSIEYGALANISDLQKISVATGNEYYYSAGNCLITTGGELIAGCDKSEIPTGVKSIGKYAFKGCENLSSIVVPNGVASIGDYVFQNCDSLSNITIPSSVLSIGQGAIPSSVLGFNWQGTLNHYVTIYAVPNSYAAEWAKKYGYKYEKMSESFADGDTNYEYTELDDGTIQINSCVSEEEDITVPEMINGKTVTSIGDRAFCECTDNLSKITLPDSVTSIGKEAFAGCSRLTSINIPASVTNIATLAFDACNGLEAIEVAKDNGVYYSEQNCVIEQEKKELVLGCKNSIIPEGITSIGTSAFSGCTGLTSVTIPASVTSIGDSAFSGCSGLETVTFQEGLTSIAGSAFKNCSKLTEIKLPNSVESIADNAFSGCEDLIIVADKDSYAAKWAKEHGFAKDDSDDGKDDTGKDDSSGDKDDSGKDNPSGDNGSQNDKPSGDQNQPSGDNGNQNNNTGNNGAATPTTPAATQPTAPAATAEVKKPAAAGTVLDGAIAGVSVKVTSDQAGNPTVEYTAVTNKKAKTVMIPDSVTVDGITYKVTSVSAKAFAGCKKLTQITIGANVTTIGKNAFKNCKGLKVITIKSTTLDKKAFAKAGVKKLSKKVTIKVPKNCKKDYKKQLKKAGFKGKVK